MGMTGMPTSHASDTTGEAHPPIDHSPRRRALPVNTLAVDSLVTVNLPTPKCALAVGAHPDDIEFGCGATLAKWAAAGCRIHHLILTDGSKGSWNASRDRTALIAARQREQLQAAKLLGGGEVGFLGFVDGELCNGVRERSEVCRWIRMVRPDIVLGHDPWRRYRLHPDHRNAGYILTDAVVAARDPLFFADQELDPHRPTAVLLWEADVPNHVEETSSYVATKIRALLAHTSQHETTMGIHHQAANPASDLDSIDHTDQVTALGANADADGPEAFALRVQTQMEEHGRLGGVEIGESFHLITDV